MRIIRRVSSVIGLTTFALFGAASVAGAQAAGSGSVFSATPYVGYMVFGNYLSGPLGTSLSNAPGVVYGTQFGLKMAPQISLIGNLGYTQSDMKVGIPILGGVSVGHSSMLMYDAGLEYDLGKASASSVPFSPFIQAGVGAIRYNVDAISVLSTQATNFAGNVGVGADITVANGIGFRVLAKDYIGKFNFQDATGLDINGETAHNLAFSAGLRFDF